MLDYRESRELWEWENLAPYAAHSSDPSLSWRRSEADERVRQGDPIFRTRPHHYFPERRASVSLSGDLAGSLSRFKTAFQIDKERITGSTAFRRLEYKTQVFVTHVGDHYRTRLTHVIEVNEAARIIGQALRLNENLIEAITLGHDLGHTPFGHAGESTLNEMFKKYWPREVAPTETEWGIFGPAFYHNVQGVRVVDTLEKGYEWDRRPRIGVNPFDHPLSRRGWGMDLTWAVREGILKHSSRGLKADQVRMYGSEYLMKELDPFQPATIEGQVVEFADEVTSIMHDLEDGLRYRLFTLDELQDGLMQYISQENLLALLGLSMDFGERSNKTLESRVKKLRDLLDTIVKKKDRTVGTLLALLRTIFISNLIETTSLRLRQVLRGFPGTNENNVSHGEPHDENEYLLVFVRMGTDGRLQPTPDSYCFEAWDPASRIDRMAKFVHLRYNGRSYEHKHTELPDAPKLIWQQNATRASQRRMIQVSKGGHSDQRYALGHVSVKISGSKVVGYSSEILQLRNWLRKEFIPTYIHRNSMVMRMNDKGQKYIREIFEHFVASPFSMHSRSLKRFGMTKPEPKDSKFLLRIAEHLQGMTDRYLQQVYSHLFLPGSGHGIEPDEVTLVDGDRPAFEEE